MSEPTLREIQLSTKQVVFLFMACVLAAVVIFLLGVAVGDGVNSDSAVTEAVASPAPSAEASSTGTVPPPTTPKPGELQYHDALQGKTDSKAARPAMPPSPPPESPPDRTPQLTPAATPPAAKPAASAPAGPKPTSAKPAPAPTSDTVFVQVDSFGSKANADRQLAQLKAKGITAFVFTAPGPGARYKVRIGPFAERAAADAMLIRLRKEGFRPSVTR